PGDDTNYLHGNFGISDFGFRIFSERKQTPLTHSTQFEIRNPKFTSAFHSEYCVGIVLMSNLVNFLSLPLAHVQSIWTIDNDSLYLTNVLVSMHNARRHDHRFRIILTNHYSHYVFVGVRIDAIVPHPQLET